MKVVRVKLRNWLQLASIREKISKERKDVGNLILKYLELSSDISLEEKMLPWFEIKEAFFQSISKNDISIPFPILKTSPEQEIDVPWDYEGRDWYYWLNLLSSQYGWNPEIIEDLDIDDAIGLLQEIELERQFEREWDHQLSELSYKYEKSSKKSKYVPMRRPRWMSKLPDETKLKRKIPKRFVPPGVIKKVDYENSKTSDDQ